VSPPSISSTVGALVAERPARARLFERLAIDYCCGGNRPLDEVCRERGLDPTTVASLVDALDGGGEDGADWARRPLVELCDHIVEVHHSYLRRELPRLAALLEKTEHAHADERPELRQVRATFERLRGELDQHLENEERTLFPAVRRLGPDEPFTDATVVCDHLEDEHAAVGALLAELAELTGGYDTTRANCNTHRAAIDGLRELERDLHEHVHEENNILFPRLLGRAPRRTHDDGRRCGSGAGAGTLAVRVGAVRRHLGGDARVRAGLRSLPGRGDAAPPPG
jgi:regulator of cell morphogenesis and NO signaling